MGQKRPLIKNISIWKGKQVSFQFSNHLANRGVLQITDAIFEKDSSNGLTAVSQAHLKHKCSSEELSEVLKLRTSVNEISTA